MWNRESYFGCCYLFLFLSKKFSPVGISLNTGSNNEHDGAKDNERFSVSEKQGQTHENADYIGGGFDNESSRANESYNVAARIDGASDFADALTNGDGESKSNVSNVRGDAPANGNGAEGKSVSGNLEDGYFSDAPYRNGEGNTNRRSQPGSSKVVQADQKDDNGEDVNSRNETGGGYSVTPGQTQKLTGKNGDGREISEPQGNTNDPTTGSKQHSRSILWADVNEGASGHSGDTHEEGSSDDWENGSPEATDDPGSQNDTQSSPSDGDGLGDGSNSNRDDSPSASEENISQSHQGTSAGNSESVEWCHETKENGPKGSQKTKKRILSLQGVIKVS